jgi:hypothetical protein
VTKPFADGLDISHLEIQCISSEDNLLFETNTNCRVSGPVMGELPAGYSSWANLKVFEVKNTQLSGTIPSSYFSNWRQLENFTIDGALITGRLPDPWACTNLLTYWVQNTPVTSNISSPVWILDPRAASLRRMQMIGLGG